MICAAIKTARMRHGLLLIFVVLATCSLFAATTGSISGTARDGQGAVVPNTKVVLRNTLTGVMQTLTTDSAGFYNFPSLTIGHYDITFESAGFDTYQEKDVIIDVDTARRVDATLKPSSVSEQVTVTATADQAQVDTETSQMGEVIGSAQIENVPLDGRAYTDLLALQPGVAPIQVQYYSSEAPANNLNNGLQSISGAQDVHSGFMVNGANTVEGAGEGTFLIPTLDSIAEFRIVTNNAGAEYGGYAGGLTNVVTKSGTNQFHGDAFEYFRNGDLNATGYFAGGPPNLKQNIFGGTFGGPILRNKVFFFGDYQGLRNSSGSNINATVLSDDDRNGNLSDRAGQFTQHPKNVSGPYFASLLSSRLGYTVTAGEPYYFDGCQDTTQCVLPTLQLPQSSWDPVSLKYLGLIPKSNSNLNGQPHYASNAAETTLTENKGAVKVDANTRWGQLSGYYHLDPWDNPAPPTFGSSVPGFPNDTLGKAQLYVASLTTPLGSTAANSFTASYTRNKYITGVTSGGGATLASVGFADPSNGGPYQFAAGQYQNMPYLNFMGLGAPMAVVTQFNNTYEGQEDFSKVFKTHTLKFGVQYHWDQIDIAHPYNASNGEFLMGNAETGDPYADFMLGALSVMYQGTPAGLNLRNFYAGIYGEDSWRATKNLTINYGVRWEVDPWWSEAHNNNPVELPGVQSTHFPSAPLGYAFPGEAGIPTHMANINWDNFGPRVGAAYTPNFSNPILRDMFGDPGKSSIRVGYGLYFTNIEGFNTYNFAAAPTHLFYSTPEPSLLSQPFIGRKQGDVIPQPFPIDPQNFNWAKSEPLSARRNPLIHEASPYEEHLDLSLEREVTAKTIVQVAYVGTFGHHLTVGADGNSGNAALCMSLSDPSAVTDGNTCGPYGENSWYSPVNGAPVHGTRQGMGPLYKQVIWDLDVGNSSYNALEATLRHTTERLSILLSYTYSKAMDNGSGRGDLIFLDGNRNQFRGLSDYDVPSNFAGTYTYELPFDKLIHGHDRLVRGWKLSGVTRFTNGVPIWIMESDDNNLRGDNSGSAWGVGDDEPMLAAGDVKKGDHNPRHQQPWFNVNLFSTEPVGGQGNSGRRYIHGPGINNTDLVLMKQVRVKEGMTAEFRAEGFNAFNHAQFAGSQMVDGEFTDGIPNLVNGQNQGGTFGLIVGGSDGGRVGELGVKFIF